MDANTINGSTFTLTKPDGPDTDTNPDAVSGTVAYDPTSNKVTLSPNANLDYSTTFTATVNGGANGVKDAASNPLPANEVGRSPLRRCLLRATYRQREAAPQPINASI
jgi:Bacterial Ig-like domain